MFVAVNLRNGLVSCFSWPNKSPERMKYSADILPSAAQWCSLAQLGSLWVRTQRTAEAKQDCLVNVRPSIHYCCCFTWKAFNRGDVIVFIVKQKKKHNVIIHWKYASKTRKGVFYGFLLLADEYWWVINKSNNQPLQETCCISPTSQQGNNSCSTLLWRLLVPCAA